MTESEGDYSVWTIIALLKLLTMINKQSSLFFYVMQFIFVSIAVASNQYGTTPVLSLTISARTRSLEVAWRKANLDEGDVILITTEKPIFFQKLINEFGTAMTGIDNDMEVEASGGGSISKSTSDGQPRSSWQYNNSTRPVIYELIPKTRNEWVTTRIPFNYALSKAVTVDTKCYGFWASYINANGTILTESCVSAYPKWMNEMRSQIENFHLRDLFIPGTHDSGSYRYRFDPAVNETLVTKYSLTQDEDVRGQLMHGIRYLDIRVGYYRSSSDLFWANHGISRQRPLREVLEQVLDFVQETNEIVIFDVQEFPVGFGRSLDIHRKLVHFIKSIFGNYIVDPSLTWQATLKDIWQRKQNIIVCYDNYLVVEEYPLMLFQAIEQRWGNVQRLSDLERFLNRKSQSFMSKISYRPVADMAELTPDTWGVLTDSYGGLRYLSDFVNRFVSKWYEDTLGMNANIVAVDFYRGTTIVETAIEWNSNKIV